MRPQSRELLRAQARAPRGPLERPLPRRPHRHHPALLLLRLRVRRVRGDVPAARRRRQHVAQRERIRAERQVRGAAGRNPRPDDRLRRVQPAHLLEQLGVVEPAARTRLVRHLWRWNRSVSGASPKRFCTSATTLSAASRCAPSSRSRPASKSPIISIMNGPTAPVPLCPAALAGARIQFRPSQTMPPGSIVTCCAMSLHPFTSGDGATSPRSVVPPEVRVPRPPCVMQVHRVHAPREREPSSSSAKSSNDNQWNGGAMSASAPAADAGGTKKSRRGDRHRSAPEREQWKLGERPAAGTRAGDAIAEKTERICFPRHTGVKNDVRSRGRPAPPAFHGRGGCGFPAGRPTSH